MKLGAIHKPRSPFFQNFEPLFPQRSHFYLNSCYVVLWFFEEPPLPPLVATWFVYDPLLKFISEQSLDPSHLLYALSKCNLKRQFLVKAYVFMKPA